MGRREWLPKGRITGPYKPVPLVEIAGEHRVLMEHHQGILAYSCEMVVVRVGFGLIRIMGKKLCVASMTREQLVICGQIESVSLDRTGRDCSAG